MRTRQGEPGTPEAGTGTELLTSEWRETSYVGGQGWWRRYDDVVGMNARNAHIARANPPEAIRLVADKAATKDVLTAHDVPVAPTIAVIRDGRWARRLGPGRPAGPVGDEAQPGARRQRDHDRGAPRR